MHASGLRGVLAPVAHLIVSGTLVGCGAGRRDPLPPPQWETGFWFWHGSSASVTAQADPLDVIFCHVSTVSRTQIPLLASRWVYGSLPTRLPPAREYWLVFRFDGLGVPPLEVGSEVARVASELEQEAHRRGLRVAGIQLDIDSPTGKLPEYAIFLGRVKNGLRPGIQVSIAALLDWFRSGTAIDDVLDEVDEFVPQFYDVQDRRGHDGGTPIASRLEAAEWGSRLNRYRKRFRIGISTFGRAKQVDRGDASQPGYPAVWMRYDLRPLDIAVDPAFSLQTSRTQANELVLSYQATRKTRVGYRDLEPGDRVQFVLASPEAVREAVGQAKLIRGNCAGVVFFRWPGFDESLAMQPDEVLAAAGVTGQRDSKPDLHVIDGACAAVSCVDLYLMKANPLSSRPIHYRIHSSVALEYFVPNERMPARMAGHSTLEMTLPPYCGRARMYLGRAVCEKASKFRIEESE